MLFLTFHRFHWKIDPFQQGHKYLKVSIHTFQYLLRSYITLTVYFLRIGRVRFFHSWPTWDLLMINFINFTRVQPESIIKFLTGQKVNLQPMLVYFNIFDEWILSTIYIWSCLRTSKKWWSRCWFNVEDVHPRFPDLISTISFIVETNFKMFQLDRNLSPEVQRQWF